MNRHEWLVGLMPMSGGEHVLEIGCGSGSAVALTCGKLRDGTITAIDRSEKMVQQAINRNMEFITQGKARIIQAELHEAMKILGIYRVIYAMNVNCFWQQAKRELEAVKSLLDADGTVYLANVPPGAGEIPHIAARTEANLALAGFRIVDVIDGLVHDIPGVCVIAKHY